MLDRLGWILPDGQSIQTIVSSLQSTGVHVIVSFGGATGTEPALACSSAASLQALHQSVITRYKVNLLDFDIEGGAVSDQASITRRDQALKALKAANPGLVISYTLPVLPTGLSGSCGNRGSDQDGDRHGRHYADGGRERYQHGDLSGG